MKVTCDWLVMVPLTVGAVVPTGCVVVPPDVERLCYCSGQPNRGPTLSGTGGTCHC